MDKMVFVKTLERPLDKNGKEYTKVTDQDNQTWAFFRQDIQFQIGKAYLFTYTMSEKGFPNIEKVTPLVNLFVQQALKEVANKNDILREFTMILSYAKDLAVEQLIPIPEIIPTAKNLYFETINFVEAEYAKTQQAN